MIAGARIPQVPSRLPYLGSALEFGRDPEALFERCRRRYGDTFTLLLAGHRRTFLCDPLDYPTFFQTRDLNFFDISTKLAARVFDYDWTSMRGWDMETMTHHLAQFLKGEDLEGLNVRMMERFPRAAAGARGAEWTTAPLNEWLGERVFAASTDSIFGDGFHTPAIYRHYQLFDRYFPLVAVGIPARLLRGCRPALETLSAAVEKARADRCRLLGERERHFGKQQVPRRDQGRLNVGILWASQANTIPTAFWTLIYLLRDRVARARVMAELDSVLGGRPLEEVGPDALKQFELLDSAISETLRLQSYSLLLRSARVPLTIPLQSGQTLSVGEGDQVCLFTRLLHIDPEVYPDPYTFVVDRYLGAPAFTKAGRRLTFPLMAFGGGVSTCPGRFFARNEVKIVVATLLGRYDVELCSSVTPDSDRRRIGLGVMPPVSDVRFRFRPRSS